MKNYSENNLKHFSPMFTYVEIDGLHVLLYVQVLEHLCEIIQSTHCKYNPV